MTVDRRDHFDAVWQARQVSGGDPDCLAENRRVTKTLSLLRGGERLLDVGCGYGTLGAAVQERFREIHGVDVSTTAVAEARKRGVKAQVFNAGADPLPFVDATFDAVAALGVLQYVVDVDRLLRDCRRVLRPGGQLVVAVPNLRAAWRVWKLAVLGQVPRTSLDPIGRDGGTLHYFTSALVLSQLEDAGFEIAGSCGIHNIPSWLEGRLDGGRLGRVKREFFSAELVFDARACPRLSPAPA